MREQLDRRPLLVFGAGLVVGLTALAHPLNLLALPLLFACLMRMATRAVFLIGLGIGLLLAPPLLVSVLDRSYVKADGTVVGLPRTGAYGTTFNFATKDRIWRATVRAPQSLHLGDRLRVTGIGRPLREGSEQYLELHGVTAQLTVRSLAVVARGPMSWQISSAWRESFHAFAYRWLPEDAASLTEAMCFDMSSGLDPGTTAALRESGTLHLVAASGLHVFLIGGAALFLLSQLPVPRPVQIAVLALVLALYAGATGLSPAVVRASAMIVVGLGAYLLRREPDALSALALAGVAYLLWQPREVYDPGFQISFVTVGAIAFFFHPERRAASELVRVTKNWWRVSWIAFVASAPLLAYHFGFVSLVALPSNLFVGLAASIGIVSALLAHLASLIWPALGVGLLTVVTGPMAGWILWSTEHTAGHPWSSATLPGFSAYWLPVVYGALLLTWRPRIVQP